MGNGIGVLKNQEHKRVPPPSSVDASTQISMGSNNDAAKGEVNNNNENSSNKEFKQQENNKKLKCEEIRDPGSYEDDEVEYDEDEDSEDMDEFSSVIVDGICSWRLELVVGSRVDAFDVDGRWFDAEVLEVDGSDLLIHYRGWNSKWDIWLSRETPRIQKLFSQTCDWRNQVNRGDSIEINSESLTGVDSRVKWVLGYVVDVKLEPTIKTPDSTNENSNPEMRRLIKISTDGYANLIDSWIDMDSEDVCFFGTHTHSKSRKNSRRMTPIPYN